MKSMAANKPAHVVKADVFDVLGFPPSEACVLKIKSELLSAILEEIKMKGYTQALLADVLDEYRPVVRNLLRGRVSLISIEKLLRYAHRLRLQTRIAVRPIGGRNRRARAEERERRTVLLEGSHRPCSIPRTSRSGLDTHRNLTIRLRFALGGRLEHTFAAPPQESEPVLRSSGIEACESPTNNRSRAR